MVSNVNMQSPNMLHLDASYLLDYLHSRPSMEGQLVMLKSDQEMSDSINCDDEKYVISSASIRVIVDITLNGNLLYISSAGTTKTSSFVNNNEVYAKKNSCVAGSDESSDQDSDSTISHVSTPEKCMSGIQDPLFYVLENLSIEPLTETTISGDEVYPFEIVFSPKQESVILYAQTNEERSAWIDAISTASQEFLKGKIASAKESRRRSIGQNMRLLSVSTSESLAEEDSLSDLEDSGTPTLDTSRSFPETQTEVQQKQKAREDALALASVDNSRLCTSDASVLKHSKALVRDKLSASLYSSLIKRSFVFDPNEKWAPIDGIGDQFEQLLVEEGMAECKIGINIPMQCLTLCIGRQEMRLAQIENMYYLPPKYASMRDQHAKILRKLIDKYKAAQTITEKMDSFFLPSSKKTVVGTEFVPVNLHYQQLVAWTESKPKESVDIFTAGAITTMSLGYKDGGLKSMKMKLKQLLFGKGASPLPLAPSPTAAYWEQLLDLTEQQQRLGYLKAQIMKTTCHGVINEAFFQKMVGDLWDVLAILKSIGDRLELSEEVSVLAEYFDEYRSSLGGGPDPDQNSDDVIFDTEIVPPMDLLGEQRENMGSPTTSPLFELERLDTQYSELEAHMACVMTKVNNLERIVTAQKAHASATDEDQTPDADSESDIKNWVLDLRRSAFIVIASLERLGRTFVDAWNFRYVVILNDSASLDLFCRCEYREDALMSQALSVIVASVAAKFWDPQPQSFQKQPLGNNPALSTSWANGTLPSGSFLAACHGLVANTLPFLERLGFLAIYNSYLSCFRYEKCMLEDLAEAIDMVRHRAAIKLVKSFSVGSCLPIIEGGHPPVSLRISIPISADIWQHLPESVRGGYPVKITPILFVQGINDDETFALKLGDVSYEHQINEQSFKLLREYVESLCDFAKNHEASLFNCDILKHSQLCAQLISDLGTQVAAKKAKDVEILHFASRICRLLHGSLVVGCKSGKDRSSMAVTLEEAFWLRERFGLPEAMLQVVLDRLREEGTRRQNVRKNRGDSDMYAFTTLQHKLLPLLYRPPKGTFASGAS